MYAPGLAHEPNLCPMGRRGSNRSGAGGMMSSFFSVLALFLARVGLYGVTDFSVYSRLRETGIRLALGASRSSIVGLVLGRVLRQLGLGLLIGLAGGFLLAKPMSAALVGITTWDPLVYGSVVVILTLTALLSG
jgi:putative ABC transport system permease protein